MRLAKTSSPSIVGANALSALRRHLRIESDWADSDLLDILGRVIAEFEEWTHTQLLTATYEFRFGKFYSCMELPRSPLVSVQAVKYIDGDDAEQTWASTEYDVHTDTQPGRVVLGYDKIFPAPARDILIEYTAGYGTAWTDIPELTRSCLLLMCGHYYFNRDGSPLPAGIMNMITQLITGDEFAGYVN